MMSSQEPKPPVVFNSVLENGLRSLVVLVACAPDSHDLDRLVLLDYVLVHSSDFNASLPSLHPQVPQRFGEVLVRRPLIETGIHFMVSRGLIEQGFTAEGRLFFAAEGAHTFLETLTTPYIIQLRERADWVVQQFGKLSTSALETEFSERVPVFEFSRAVVRIHGDIT